MQISITCKGLGLRVWGLGFCNVKSIARAGVNDDSTIGDYHECKRE